VQCTAPRLRRKAPAMSAPMPTKIIRGMRYSPTLLVMTRPTSLCWRCIVANTANCCEIPSPTLPATPSPSRYATSAPQRLAFLGPAAFRLNGWLNGRRRVRHCFAGRDFRRPHAPTNDRVRRIFRRRSPHTSSPRSTRARKQPSFALDLHCISRIR
jgi:hypothetical protein